MTISVDCLLHDSFEIFIECFDEPLLRLRAPVPYRTFPESVVGQVSFHEFPRKVEMHLLTSHFPANPFSLWSWLVRVAESIHYNDLLLSDFGGLGHIRVFIDDEE